MHKIDEISIDYNKVIESISKKKLLRRLIISSAIITVFLPLFTKDLLTKESKLALAITGSILAGACCKLPKFEYEEKLRKTYEDTQLKQHKLILQGELAKLSTALEISNTQNLADVVEHLPEHQIDYFSQKYGVTAILPQHFIEENSQNTFNNSVTEQSISVDKKSISQPTIYCRDAANMQWIDELVNQFCLPQGKRLHEHIMINGGTQAGKSTLVSIILTKIINHYGANAYSEANGRQVTLNLIDPKYPMTTWIFEPTFTGFENVMNGVQQAINELDNRKKLASNAKKNCQSIPVFNPYLLVVDEWDIVFGNGKGYSNVIGKDDAKDLLAMIKRIICEGAAYDVRVITIGQSPLTTDNGINRSLAKQTTRIVVGQESLSWLQDPGFPFKSDVTNLIDELVPLLKQEKRVALICPNKGAVRVWEIPKIELQDVKEPQDEQTHQEPKTEGSEAILEVVDKIVLACNQFHNEYQTYPSKELICELWRDCTGKVLNEKGWDYLSEILKKKGIYL